MAVGAGVTRYNPPPMPDAHHRPRPDSTFYVTTPIYYVNDRPHIGHVYTTTVADVLARLHRLRGERTFFLTGTDEHAAKVVDAAEARGLSPQEWADHNAAEFQNTFERLGISNDDFIRTSQDRHKRKVIDYIRQLIASGDVYLGEYEGWYDEGQEEYVPESRAKETDYKSPVTGKPLVRKTENNDFFALSKYGDKLQRLLGGEEVDGQRFIVQPEARRNEMLSRIRDGLNDTPISRTGARGWGIPVPDQEGQTIYVWIDALFNYLSTVDTDERRELWPADVHLIGKDILWFHCVIWPAMLLALGRRLPRRVYAHSWWVRPTDEDPDRLPIKMSKSLGNIVSLEELDAYAAEFSLDALRYFLVTQGPLSASDSLFAGERFVETYNADLANTLGNSVSRVTNMIGRYCGGLIPEGDRESGFGNVSDRSLETVLSDYVAAADAVNLSGMAKLAMDLVAGVDGYIERTQPFKLAKQEGKAAEVGAILYACAEALRLASLLLWPIMPRKCEELWRRMGVDYAAELEASGGLGRLDEWARWGLLEPGTALEKGDPLFPRHES